MTLIFVEKTYDGAFAVIIIENNVHQSASVYCDKLDAESERDRIKNSKPH
jgi:hypothetical protein